MEKVKQMLNNLKSKVISMDKKNKVILFTSLAIIVAAIAIGGNALTTIGKTADDKIKQTESTKDNIKDEDKKKDSKTESQKKDEEKVDQKGKEKKKKESETSEKESKTSDKKESAKNNEKTSTKESGKSSSASTNQSNSSSNSNKGTSSSNSNKGSSSSGNTGQTTKPIPTPQPKPTPKPEPKPEPTPQPSEPTIDKEATEQMKQDIISQAQQNPGGMFSTMDEASAWAMAQVRDKNSPFYGKLPGAADVGLGAEVYGYIAYFEDIPN